MDSARRTIRGSNHVWRKLLLWAAFSGAAQAQVIPIIIVSVGDSYASGEGAPDAPPGSPSLWLGDNRDGAAGGCHRSLNAAPAVAARLVRSIRPSTFFHFACTGHKVADLMGTGGELATAVSKLPAGTPAIDALIVSIGGDDVNFAPLVLACMVTPCDPGITATTVNVAAVVPPRLAALATSIAALRPPVRHVFLTAYPLPSSTPFPPPEHLCGTPFAPNIPFHGFDNLLAPRAELARMQVVDPLNAALAAAVTSANAGATGGPVWHFVDRLATSFNGHGYCMGLPNPLPHMWVSGRYINTLVDSVNTQSDVSGTMHPNAAGYAAMGAELAGSILANVPIVTRTMPVKPGRPSLPADEDALSKLCKKQPNLPACRDRQEPKPDRGPVR